MAEDLDIDELEQLADGATPGPWSIDGRDIVYDQADIDGWTVAIGCLDEDAAFIAAARNAVPKLIARIRELESQVESLEMGDDL